MYASTNHIQGYLRPLLETLLTSKIASQLESFLQSESREDGLRNMWLMGPPARNAFRNGQIEITRLPSYGGYDFNTEVVLPKVRTFSFAPFIIHCSFRRSFNPSI